MEPSKINAQQVGGDHYQTSYAHWDLVLNLRLGYMEGQATRYIVRWRKKDGFKDLQKALHYINKMIEALPERLGFRGNLITVREVDWFSRANQLSELEHTLVLNIALWHSVEDLVGIREMLLLLMDSANPDKPARLTEENHYSEREDPVERMTEKELLEGLNKYEA